MTKAILAVTAVLMLPMAPATAGAFKCREGFQDVQGSLISTPYCRDNYIAEVARDYGMKASPEAVRNNPNYKRELCRFIGRDIRIQEACIEVSPWGRGRY